MKLLLIAVCCVALATARPNRNGESGDSDGGRKGKNGPNPVKGLVKLCIDLAEEALEDGDKRSWEDVFGQLTPLCEAILQELENEEGKGPRPSGPPPSGMPPKQDDDRRGRNGGDRKQGGGGRGGSGEEEGNDRPRPSGPPPSGKPDWLDRDARRGGKARPRPSGAPPKSGSDDEDDGEDFVYDLLRICEGLAKMAEKEEEQGVDKKSLESLLTAMESVCEAAFNQAQADDMI